MSVSQELQVVDIEGIKVSQDQINLVKSTIFPDCTDDELRLFFYECRRRGVHPLDRLIFPIKRNVGQTGEKRVTFQASIDYLRAASEDTGKYLGMEPIEYGDEVDVEGHADVQAPVFATCTVTRILETGETVKVPYTARWKEFYPGEKMGFMWRSKPYLMLGKCAEAGARRVAFPRELGGLYANEEVEGAESVPFTTKSETVRPAKASGGVKPDEKPGELSKVKESLWAELVDRTGGDHIEMAALLKRVSAFPGDGGKEIFIELNKLGGAGEGWCGKVLAKLRAEKK